MNITYKQVKNIDKSKIARLYSNVGWTAYTNNMNQLHQALSQSYDVTSAWDKDILVGLVRTVSDGLTILYIQDILVLISYQNNGIASMLIEIILEKHKTVRQKIL